MLILLSFHTGNGFLWLHQLLTLVKRTFLISFYCVCEIMTVQSMILEVPLAVWCEQCQELISCTLKVSLDRTQTMRPTEGVWDWMKEHLTVMLWCGQASFMAPDNLISVVNLACTSNLLLLLFLPRPLVHVLLAGLGWKSQVIHDDKIVHRNITMSYSAYHL